MSFSETIKTIRKEKNLSQEELARMLFVTRQAVSRWENGNTVPGIDMIKLIAINLQVPVSRLIEMPDHYCQSCGMILTDEILGSDRDGHKNPDYCKWCYDDGKYQQDLTMDEMIEFCAPHFAQGMGISSEEAVSFLGAVYPWLERWKQGKE